MQEKEKLQKSEVEVIKFEEKGDIITFSVIEVGAEDPKNTPGTPPAIPFD